MRPGTNNMIRTVFWGLTPAVRNAAYETAPTIPEPPVPDAYVDTTLLETNYVS